MVNYIVDVSCDIEVSVSVEADNEEDAKMQAEEIARDNVGVVSNTMVVDLVTVNNTQAGTATRDEEEDEEDND